MSKRRTTRRSWVTPRERQMLAGAYWPVIVFTLVRAGWTARLTTSED